MHHIINEFKSEIETVFFFEDTDYLRLMLPILNKIFMITYNCGSIEIKFKL